MIKFLKVNKRVNRKPKKWLKVLSAGVLCLLVVLGALGLVGYFFVFKPALAVVPSIQKLPAHVKPLKDAILLQDLVAAKVELVIVDQDLTAVEESLTSLSWLDSVPLAGSYFEDSQRVLRVARHTVAAGQKIIEAVTPAAEALGFKTETTEAVQMGMEERIAGAIKVMPEVAEGLDSLDPELAAIKNEIAAINPARYPQFLSFQGRNVRELLIQVQSYANQLDELLPQVKRSFEVLPGVLGYPGQKTYVIIFQNDKEIRPTGGFWTAYALAKVSQGKVTDLTSEDMYFVDYRIPLASKAAAPAVYQRFLKIDHWFIRDANLSPDYKVAVSKFLGFWRQAQMTPVDGVLALDTFLVRDLLELVGPVEVSGYNQKFTHENVVLELEKQAMKNKEQPGRKALVGQLMDKMMEKVLETPKNKYDDLIALILKLASEKHLVMYFDDKAVQSWAEDFNWAGRIREFEGDYLQVNEANFAGAKANLYVTREVRQSIRYSDSCHSEGEARRISERSFADAQDDEKRSQDDERCWIKEVTIDFENPQAYDGWLNGPYRCYVRLLVPEGSELISVEGGEESVPQESFFDEALGKQVFAAFNITKTKDKSQLSFKYKLPDSVIVDGKYRLLVQKQPGHDAPSYEVTVNGETEKFELGKDREIEIEVD